MILLCSRRTKGKSNSFDRYYPKKWKKLRFIQPMDIKVKKQTLSCSPWSETTSSVEEAVGGLWLTLIGWTWPWAEQEKGSSWFHQNNTLRNQNFPRTETIFLKFCITYNSTEYLSPWKNLGAIEMEHTTQLIFHVPCEIIEFELEVIPEGMPPEMEALAMLLNKLEHKSEEHQIPLASKVRMIRKGYVNEPLLDYQLNCVPIPSIYRFFVAF